MIILKFFLWLLIILIIILIMPIKYISEMKINTNNTKFEIYLCAKYFFGAIKYEYPSNKLKIFGINIIENIKANTRSNNKANNKANKKKSLKTKAKKYKINKPERTKKINKKIDLCDYNTIYFLVLTGLKFTSFIFDIKKKIWPKKIIIKGEIGFDDPAHTGYLCALDSLIKKFINNLELKYNFNKKITQLDIFLSGKIYLLNLIFVLAKHMLNKSLISFIKSNFFTASSQNQNKKLNQEV